VLVKIDGYVIDYEGEGCYNFVTGERVRDIHLHSVSGDIQYVNLDDSVCTHDYQEVRRCPKLVRDWESFAIGVLAGLILIPLFLMVLAIFGVLRF
jgi:hypothetical protein